MCRQGGARKRKGPLKGTKGRERFRTEEAFYTNPIPDCLCRQQVSVNTTTALFPNRQSGIDYMPKKESHTTEIDTGLRQAGGQDSSSQQQKYTRWQVSFIHVPCKMCAVATNPIPYTPTYNACTTNTPGVTAVSPLSHPWSMCGGIPSLWYPPHLGKILLPRQPGFTLGNPTHLLF